MDKKIIFNKIESLRQCIKRIKEKAPETAEKLLEDYDLQDIICVNLERAVQICVDIAAHIVADFDVNAPATMAESFEKLIRLGFINEHTATRMQKAVGFRNIAVHTYQDIDWEVVYEIITKHLSDFDDYAREVVENVDKKSKQPE
jgi:uncharacterized protein YutE (UPF0331/DUF86 family)